MIRPAGLAVLVVVATFLLVETSGQAIDSAYLLHYDPSTTLLGTSELQSPVWMAIFSDEEGSRFLVARDEPLFGLHQPQPVGLVRGIDAEAVTISVSGTRRTVRVVPGEGIPGTPNLIYRGAAQVRSIEYRRRVIPQNEKKHRDGELYLVAVRNSRAIVQRDSDPSAASTSAQVQRIAAIPLVQTGPHAWEVRAKDVQVAIESGESIAVQSLRDGQVGLSLGSGLGVEVKSPLADVRVDPKGFVITSPNLASRAGLEVGDRIVEVNGMPIDGIGSLMRVYQQVKSTSSLGMVSVTVERHDLPVTLTYRIR